MVNWLVTRLKITSWLFTGINVGSLNIRGPLAHSWLWNYGYGILENIPKVSNAVHYIGNGRVCSKCSVYGESWGRLQTTFTSITVIKLLESIKQKKPCSKIVTLTAERKWELLEYLMKNLDTFSMMLTWLSGLSKKLHAQETQIKVNCFVTWPILVTLEG